MATPGDLLALALTKVGYRYSTGPTRTTGADGYFDCSGFTYFLDQHVGGPTPSWDPQSHLQALYCRDHGLLVPIDQAINTPGALLFEGPDHAYVGGFGIPGHVAVSLGNGSTVEAMGHAWGTCIGRAAGRGWSNAGLFPGIDYSQVGPTPTHPDPVPGPQLGDEMAIVIPAHGVYANGRRPFASLDFQDGNVVCYNAMKINWIGAPTTSKTFGDALVYDIPINGPFLGMEEGEEVRVMPNGDHIVQKNGSLVVVAGDGGVATATIVLP